MSHINNNQIVTMEDNDTDNELVNKSNNDIAEENKESEREDVNEINSKGSNELNNILGKTTVSNDKNKISIIINTVIEEDNNNKSAKVKKGYKDNSQACFSQKVNRLVKKGLVKLDSISMNKVLGRLREKTYILLVYHAQSTDLIPKKIHI